MDIPACHPWKQAGSCRGNHCMASGTRPEILVFEHSSLCHPQSRLKVCDALSECACTAGTSAIYSKTIFGIFHSTGQIKISFSHEKSPQACYVYCQCDESAHCMLSVKFPFLESPWKLESPKQILNTPKVLFFQGGNSFTSTDLISKSRDCSWSCTQHRSVLGETFFPVWGFSLYCTAQLGERLPGYQI